MVEENQFVLRGDIPVVDVELTPDEVGALAHVLGAETEIFLIKDLTSYLDKYYNEETKRFFPRKCRVLTYILNSDVLVYNQQKQKLYENLLKSTLAFMKLKHSQINDKDVMRSFSNFISSLIVRVLRQTSNNEIEDNISSYVSSLFEECNFKDNEEYQFFVVRIAGTMCDLRKCTNKMVFSDFNYDELGKTIVDHIFDFPDSLLFEYVSLLKKIVKLEGRNDFLKLLWNKFEVIASSETKDEEKTTRILSSISYVGTDFISIQNSVLAISILDDCTFWKLIQTCISSVHALNRKLSLYILKRVIDVLVNSQVNIKCDLFHWDSSRKSESLDIFSTLFVIFEILEGSQIHIISPVFKEINKIVLFCSRNYLEPTWLTSIFIRLFCQDSIVFLRSAILHFMYLDVKLILKDYNYKDTLNYFFQALNNMLIFSGSSESNVRSSLEAWLAKFAEIDVDVYNNILYSLSMVSWGPIPLFYVTNALSKSPKVHVWGSQSLKILKNFIVESLRTQTYIIRGGIQSQILRCISNFSKEDITLFDIADILSVFRTNECLKRGTYDWSLCSEWIKSCLESCIKSCADKAKEFFEIHIKTYLEQDVKFLPVHAVARLLIMLADANLFPSTNVDTFISMLFEPLENCDKRLYSSLDKQNNAIEFIYRLLKEGESVGSETKNALISAVQNRLSLVLQFFKFRFKTITHSDDIKMIDNYLNLLAVILENDTLRKSYCDQWKPLVDAAFSELLKKDKTLLKEYFAMKIIDLHFSYTLELLPNIIECYNFNNTFSDMILNKYFIKQHDLVPDELKKMEGIIIASNIKTVWHCFSIHIKNAKSSEYAQIFHKFPLDKLMVEGLEALNTGGKDAIGTILEIYIDIIKYYTDTEKVIEFMKATWVACFELRKSERFWISITKWISMVFQPHLMEKEELQPIIKGYALDLITQGNEIAGLANILARQFQQINSTTTLIMYNDVIIELLLFGPILRRDRKIEYETCNFIHSAGEQCSINVLTEPISTKSEIEVRLQAINLLFSDDTELGCRFISQIVTMLIETDRSSMASTTRYFNDSLIHRRKNRLLQVLLILQNYIAARQEQFQEFGIFDLQFDWVVEAILTESQQPSIKYQLEWMLTKLCLTYPHMKTKFWSVFDKASEERIGSLCSFVSVGYHLSKCDINDDFFENFVENVFPCCMSQNFTVRLYAQTTLDNLWPLYEKIAEKYKIIKKNQSKIFLQGNMLKNSKKMQSDFYFNIFDCNKHFNLQTIFWDLPRLSNLSEEEWISVDKLKQLLDIEKMGIPIGEVSDLSACETPNWVIKNSEGSEENETQESSLGLQKKFIPWKGMFPELDKEEQEQTQKKGSLVLVTSLIDKNSNLGGLARTSDVFGTKEFVLSNRECTKDKSFTSLSMTAEKHLKMNVVKHHQLIDYISTMRNKGYTIIGAEQTTTSISLPQYKFPHKTVLVLGNEREGIPANILLHLDNCVEIPQFGVIRSLNVHVTGAILMWEYAKQHLLPD